MKPIKQIFADIFQQHPLYKSVLITDTHSIFYLTGFQSTFAWIMAKKDGSINFITDGRYIEKAKSVFHQTEITCTLFSPDFCKNYGSNFSGKTLCEKTMSLVLFETLEKHFPNIELIPINNILTSHREIKTEEEIILIKKAQDHVDTLLTPFFREKLKVGSSEKSIAFELEVALKNGGTYDISFPPIIAFGSHSSIPHHEPSDQVLKQNDTILVDLGAKYRGYCSDMTRNFCIGASPPGYVHHYNLLKDAQEKTLQMYNKGESIANVEKFSREILGSNAEFFTHSLGHGVGVEVHESPHVSSKNNCHFNNNQVVTCEPGIYFSGKYGIRIEDLLVVRNSSPQILSTTTKNLIIIH